MNATEEKTYHGWRDKGTAVVTVTENGIQRVLGPRLDEVNHSPTGFEWGYGGSGPAQLAYVLVREVIGPDEAFALYQDFKSDVVALLPPTWTLTEGQIHGWVEKVQAGSRVRKG